MPREQTKHLKILFSTLVLALCLATFAHEAKAVVSSDLGGILSPDPDAPAQDDISGNSDSGSGSGSGSGSSSSGTSSGSTSTSTSSTFNMGTCQSERSSALAQCQQQIKACPATNLAPCVARIQECVANVNIEYNCDELAKGDPTNGADDNPGDYGATDDTRESSASYNTQFNQGFGPTHEDKASGPPAPNPCQRDGADLTNSFDKDPCALTRDNNNLSYAQDHQAGWRFIDHVGTWWQDNFLPDLKSMTAQLHSSIIDQTRQIGSIMDAEGVQNAASLIQKAEVETKKAMQTNENSCMAGTSQLALGASYKASGDIAKSFIYSAASRSAGMRLPGEVDRIKRLAAAERAKNGSSVFGDAEAADPASRVLSPSADQKERFETYCKYFRDPDSNLGQWDEACPESTADIEIWDGDIDIEDFLLKDTIDLAQPEQRAAAAAIMQNLLEPRIDARLPDGGTNVDGVLKTPEGQQQVLQKQHITAIRKLASGVVASMVSRRASIPGTDKIFDIAVTKYSNSDTGGEDTANPAPTTVDPVAETPATTGSRGNYTDFLKALGAFEGGGKGYSAVNWAGYMGTYQFGEEALMDLGYCKNDGNKKDNVCTWTGKDGINSKADFLANKNNVQEKAIVRFQKSGWKTIQNLGLTKYLGQTINGIVMTPSGLLAGAHLVGAGSLKKFLASNGAVVPKDGNKVPITYYIKRFGGYDTPYGAGWAGATDEAIAAANAANPSTTNPTSTSNGSGITTTTADVAVNVSGTIQEIRKNAGINEADIAKYPSYNEIMVAMTKERFMNPKYFATMANDEGAIRQEQVMVDSYIAIQLQDIYRMQEQVNMLLAARASLKLNGKAMPDMTKLMPDKK